MQIKTIALVLSLGAISATAHADEPAPCTRIGAGEYVCPSDVDSLVDVLEGTELTLHVQANEDASDLWECSGGWCTLDYGLTDDDDTVPLPSGGGTTCQDAPATCPGQDPGSQPTPKPPKKIWIKTRPSCGNAPNPCS